MRGRHARRCVAACPCRCAGIQKGSESRRYGKTRRFALCIRMRRLSFQNRANLNRLAPAETLVYPFAEDNAACLGGGAACGRARHAGLKRAGFLVRTAARVAKIWLPPIPKTGFPRQCNYCFVQPRITATIYYPCCCCVARRSCRFPRHPQCVHE